CVSTQCPQCPSARTRPSMRREPLPGVSAADVQELMLGNLSMVLAALASSRMGERQRQTVRVHDLKGSGMPRALRRDSVPIASGQQSAPEAEERVSMPML